MVNRERGISLRRASDNNVGRFERGEEDFSNFFRMGGLGKIRTRFFRRHSTGYKASPGGGYFIAA
jgi:hypothetical protein